MMKSDMKIVLLDQFSEKEKGKLIEYVTKEDDQKKHSFTYCFT